MNWNDYKVWCKEVKKYLKIPKYLLSKNNIVDAERGILRDIYGTLYQAIENSNNGKYAGVVKIKENK